MELGDVIVFYMTLSFRAFSDVTVTIDPVSRPEISIVDGFVDDHQRRPYPPCCPP
jgi:hypothetical protein